MIDRTHALRVSHQTRLVGIARSSAYYRPQPVSETDLLLIRRIDELHMEFPFAGARMLARLLRREGHEVGRPRVRTLMKRVGVEVLYCEPNTSRRNAQHKIRPYLLRGMRIAGQPGVRPGNGADDRTRYADRVARCGCATPAGIRRARARARRRLAWRAFMIVSSSARPVPALARPITWFLPASPSRHRPLTLEKDHAMKTLMFAILLSALCVALPGRASAMSPAAAAAAQTLASAAPVPLPSQPARNWNSPKAAPLTRAEVYRELYSH